MIYTTKIRIQLTKDQSFIYYLIINDQFSFAVKNKFKMLTKTCYFLTYKLMTTENSLSMKCSVVVFLELVLFQ